MITLAQDLGLQVREQELPREMVYIADEVFFAGNGGRAHAHPLGDRITVGSGKRGPVTTAVQRHSSIT